MEDQKLQLADQHIVVDVVKLGTFVCSELNGTVAPDVVVVEAQYIKGNTIDDHDNIASNKV